MKFLFEKKMRMSFTQLGLVVCLLVLTIPVSNVDAASPAAPAAGTVPAAPAGNNSSAAGEIPAAIQEAERYDEGLFGPEARSVPQWLIPPWVRKFFFFGSAFFLGACFFVVYMSQTAPTIHTVHRYTLMIVIAITLCYLSAWIIDGTTVITVGYWHLNSPRMVTWVRYLELCITAPLFIGCITAITKAHDYFANISLTFFLHFLCLNIGAFVPGPSKYLFFLTGSVFFLSLTWHQLNSIIRRAAHIQHPWRADLATTLSFILISSSIAYICLWVIGPEGLFMIYLSHAVLLMVIVDIYSHIGFVAFALSDAVQLEAAAERDPLLRQSRANYDQPVTVQNIPPQRRSDMV